MEPIKKNISLRKDFNTTIMALSSKPNGENHQKKKKITDNTVQNNPSIPYSEDSLPSQSIYARTANPRRYEEVIIQDPSSILLKNKIGYSTSPPQSYLNGLKFNLDLDSHSADNIDGNVLSTESSSDPMLSPILDNYHKFDLPEDCHKLSELIDKVSDLDSLTQLSRKLIGLFRQTFQYDPWYRKQSPKEIWILLYQEVRELFEPIKQNDPKHIANELGDILLTTFLLIIQGEAYHLFNPVDIYIELLRKLNRRAPHIFKKESISEKEAQRNWERAKSLENGFPPGNNPEPDPDKGGPWIFDNFDKRPLNLNFRKKFSKNKKLGSPFLNDSISPRSTPGLFDLLASQELIKIHQIDRRYQIDLMIRSIKSQLIEYIPDCEAALYGKILDGKTCWVDSTKKYNNFRLSDSSVCLEESSETVPKLSIISGPNISSNCLNKSGTGIPTTNPHVIYALNPSEPKSVKIDPNSTTITAAIFGGGIGGLASELIDHVSQLYIIDWSAKMLEIAENRLTKTLFPSNGSLKAGKKNSSEMENTASPSVKSNKLHFLLADVSQHIDGLSDQSIDLLVIWGPLYFSIEKEQREKILQEAHRVIRPGGLIWAVYQNAKAIFNENSSQVVYKSKNVIEGVFTHQVALTTDLIIKGQSTQKNLFNLSGKIPVLKGPGLNNLTSSINPTGPKSGHSNSTEGTHPTSPMDRTIKVASLTEKLAIKEFKTFFELYETFGMPEITDLPTSSVMSFFPSTLYSSSSSPLNKESTQFNIVPNNDPNSSEISRTRRDIIKLWDLANQYGMAKESFKYLVLFGKKRIGSEILQN